MENTQLVKKNNISAGYSRIYPLTYLQGMIDGASGKYVEELLRSINHIYVEYSESKQNTRKLVDKGFRRKGLWVSYDVDNTTITEEYRGNNIEDSSFILDSNWQTVPDLKFVQENASKIPDNAILPKHLSPSLQELINEKKEIINLPDDEDLTQDCCIIKLKDRPYVANENKGYIILRRNWENGVNVLNPNIFTSSNTIYEVRYDFNLQKKEITLPENCTLLFKGGSFNDGTFICNKTNFIGVNRFEDAGTAKFNGTYSTGLILNINNTVKWYNGSEWKTIESNSSLSDINASVVEVKSTEVATAEVNVVNDELQFKFGIPKGEKGDKGDKGEVNITDLTLTAEARESPVPYAGMETTNTSIKFNFGIPAGIQGNKGEKGEKGDKGDKGDTGATGATGPTPNYKTYIYKKSEVKPDAPTSTALIPTGWKDYPDSEGTWWQCIGQVNGASNIVSEWSEVLRVNGESIEGRKTEFRFAINTSSTTSPELIVFERDPEGWSTVPPTVSSGQYLWMTTAVVDPLDYLDSEWTTPVRISGEKGPQGATGPAGPQGPQGPTGLPGIDGNRGQLIYPAGVYSNTTSYTTDINKAPYVLDTTDNNYYVLNAQMIWLGSEQNNETPSENYAKYNGNYWLKFDFFESVYAKIGIIANGLIGSAVFNGDYMFSQQGINPSTGSSSLNYQQFDSNRVYDGSFTPNILFNFKTGAGHLAAGALKWDSNGNTSLNNLYISGYVQENYKYIDSTNQLDLSGDCKNYVITANDNTTDYWTISALNVFNKQQNSPVAISVYNLTDTIIKFDTQSSDSISGFPCRYIHLGAKKYLNLIMIPTTGSTAGFYATTYIENISDFHYEWTSAQTNINTTLVSNSNYGSMVASGRVYNTGGTALFTGNGLTMSHTAVSTSFTFIFNINLNGGVMVFAQKKDGSKFFPCTMNFSNNIEKPSSITVTADTASDEFTIAVFTI